MIIENIKNFKNGWFIGNFNPTLLDTKEFEVSVQFHPKGFIAQKHYHKISTEYNLIINGNMNICGKEMKTGDIFIFLPNEISDVQFLEDTTLVIIRTPSSPTDKHIIN